MDSASRVKLFVNAFVKTFLPNKLEIMIPGRLTQLKSDIAEIASLVQSCSETSTMDSVLSCFILRTFAILGQRLVSQSSDNLV